MKRRTYDNRGFSLIEVLTVMVILLIGIMSVIRLFPGGFLVNRKTEELTIATRLAKLEIERQKILSANLPRAIVPITPVANGASPLGFSNIVAQDVSPDDIGTEDTGPFGIDPYYLSNANKSGRRIIGETVRIPVPSPIAGNQRGSVYMLANGPFYDIQWMGSTDSIFVSGAPLNRSIQDSANPDSPIINGRSNYAIDYDDQKIAFAPESYDRSFLMTFSYYDTVNQTQTVIDEVINVTAGQNGWLSIPVPNNRPLVLESDIVARKFKRLAPGDLWAFEMPTPIDDPYEYRVISPTIGGFANVGVLAFSPIGREYTERTGGDSEPLTARIDYDVLDWHIIKEDRPLPGMPPFDVRLSLKGVTKHGEFEANNTAYQGLIRGASQPTADLLVYDVASGQLIPEINPGNGARNYTVDYREGIVHFSDVIGAQFASSNARFFYKANGDWALQVQKAVDTYRRHSPFGSADVGLGEYYLGGGAAGGSPTRMYFPLTEAGKTVTVREVFSRNNGTASMERARNETFRINDNPGAYETIGGRVLTWLDIDSDSTDGLLRQWALQDPVQPAVGVLGISFRSRVMWSDSGQIDNTAGGPVARQRWRKVNVDTFLTRSQN